MEGQEEVGFGARSVGEASEKLAEILGGREDHEGDRAGRRVAFPGFDAFHGERESSLNEDQPDLFLLHHAKGLRLRLHHAHLEVIRMDRVAEHGAVVGVGVDDVALIPRPLEPRLSPVVRLGPVVRRADDPPYARDQVREEEEEELWKEEKEE